MSTSDQQGSQPLTRKQLRELRLTGATPVISDEEAAASAAAPPAPAPLPRAADPVEIAPAPQVELADLSGDAPMTRRRARVDERIRTASVPIIDTDEPEAVAEEPSAEPELVSGLPEFAPDLDADAAVEEASVEQADIVEPIVEAEPVIDEAPVFEPVADDAPVFVPVLDEDDDEGVDDEIVEVAPVSAAAAADQPFAEPVETVTSVEPIAVDVDFADADADADAEQTPAVPAALDFEPAAAEGEPDLEAAPVVNPTFGQELLEEQSEVPAFAPSFDDLIAADSGGSQHNAPNTLIFTPSPGEGSLSGPVASTGEMLVTGSYELPQGIGSQGHAIGTADGKESDAVLIDGELPPASSPTPIAASSAVSTIKPAGEVIRPPSPEKGNKLMLTLAITAGGLALVLAAALVLAFTMKLF